MSDPKHVGPNPWDFMMPEKALEYLDRAIAERKVHLDKVTTDRINFKDNVEVDMESIAMQRKADILGEPLDDEAWKAYEEALKDWRKAKNDDAAFVAVIERTEAEIARGAIYKAKIEALEPSIAFKVSNRLMGFLGLNINKDGAVPKKGSLPSDLDVAYFGD